MRHRNKRLAYKSYLRLCVFLKNATRLIFLFVSSAFFAALMSCFSTSVSFSSPIGAFSLKFLMLAYMSVLPQEGSLRNARLSGLWYSSVLWAWCLLEVVGRRLLLMAMLLPMCVDGSSIYELASSWSRSGDCADESLARYIGLNFVPSYLSVIVFPNLCLLKSCTAKPLVLIMDPSLFMNLLNELFRVICRAAN